jgi:hypothetical protein
MLNNGTGSHVTVFKASSEKSAILMLRQIPVPKKDMRKGAVGLVSGWR